MPIESKSLSFDEFADELLAENQPRSLVILAAAKADQQLKSLIEAFLLPKNAKPNDQDELLDGDNPLGTFSSRIKFCRRAGLIDETLGKTLDKLRALRNQAAHWVSFGITSSSSLRDQLRHFRSEIEKRRSYKLTVSRFFGRAPLTPEEELQASLLTLTVLLESAQTAFTAKPNHRVAIAKASN
jgi:hypothetical protein